MTRYNVLAGVVEVIEADSPEAARAELDRRLRAADFGTYDLSNAETGLRNLAFESEDQS